MQQVIKLKNQIKTKQSEIKSNGGAGRKSRQKIINT